MCACIYFYKWSLSLLIQVNVLLLPKRLWSMFWFFLINPSSESCLVKVFFYYSRLRASFIINVRVKLYQNNSRWFEVIKTPELSCSAWSSCVDSGLSVSTWGVRLNKSRAVYLERGNDTTAQDPLRLTQTHLWRSMYRRQKRAEKQIYGKHRDVFEEMKRVVYRVWVFRHTKTTQWKALTWVPASIDL